MELSAVFDKLIDHYSKNFSLSRNVEIAGITIPVMASMRHRGQLSIMGFATNKLGPEGCEYVFILESEHFDSELLQKIPKLIEQAEREYVNPQKGHAFSFLSVIALVKETQKQAAASLKKYKYRRDYGNAGWVMSRVVVVDENGDIHCSRDSSDFKKLISKIIERDGHNN